VRGVYLGVDAGNSKTVALVATADGTVLGWGRAGVGDIYGGYGADRAAEQVCAAVRQALAAACAEPRNVQRAAFRLAGVDWPEDEQFWHSTIATKLEGLGSWSVKNDGFALLPYTGPTRTGVSVIIGTGPAIAARGPRGKEFSPSFWIQDPLGATGLGSAGFRSVIRSHLGLQPPTDMTAGFLDVFGEPGVPALLKAFTRYSDPRPRGTLGRASRTVLRAAAAGDPAASQIVVGQAGAVAEYARVAAQAVDFDPDEDELGVVLGGSVIGSEHGVFREATISALATRLPRAHLTEVPGPPVEGALLDALAEDEQQLSPGVRSRVAGPSYPAEFLQT
jgi:N-acetylglucosamine kinase-like BadF-type ATPase